MAPRAPSLPMLPPAPRVETVVTNRRCNQACAHCDRRAPTDDLRAIAPATLRQHIDAALRAGSTEILLTGGEPTLRRDLADLAAFARDRGARRITVETNGTLVDPPLAQRLREAGVTHARVNALGLCDDGDALTRDPGGAARTLDGLRALLAAGLSVDLRLALTRHTLPRLEGLTARLEGLSPRPRGLELTVPTDGPDRDALTPWSALPDALRALDARCRALAVPLSFADEDAPPPCIFADRRHALPHLFSLTPGHRHRRGHRPLDVCAQCAMRDRCPGVSEAYLRAHGTPSLQPIPEGRARRRLTRARPLADQIADELMATSLSPGGGPPQFDAIVRINFQCNQACAFCFVSTHLPPATDAQIDAALREAGSQGARVVLSGGEPTLNPKLLHWISVARAVSPRGVCLQTNAVRLDDESLARAVVDAGVDDAFVSLHGATAAVGDAVTEAPGTWERSARGIDHLHALGVTVHLNYVLCQANLHEFAAFVRLTATRWPRARVNLSFVAPSTDLVPREAALIPRYTDALPALTEALDEAARTGVTVLGFESMCGLPLCLLPPQVDADAMALTVIPEGYDGGEFVKAPGCAACRFDRVCFGLRRGYADLHGTDELRPRP